MRELKLDYENTIVHIPDLNGFRIGDRVIADEGDDHDRFEGVVIGIEMRRVYGSDRLEPCITLLHDGCITDEFKPNDLRKVEPAALHWRCFHCDEVFYDTHSAKLHFGMDQCSDPACKIKMGAEGSLVKALRTAENELSDAWAAIHNESTEAAKAYYAQQSRHGEQLRAAEEAGYERGLADGRAEGGIRITTRETKCEICSGPHDNDVLTDICTSCEARINEEGSP